jgi:Ca2+-binding RTX toxin-like protein
VLHRHRSSGGGNDVIYGGPDDDVINGGDGQDRIEGGYDDDRVDGDACDDNLSGDSGGDYVYGDLGTTPWRATWAVTTSTGTTTSPRNRTLLDVRSRGTVRRVS